MGSLQSTQLGRTGEPSPQQIQHQGTTQARICANATTHMPCCLFKLPVYTLPAAIISLPSPCYMLHSIRAAATNPVHSGAVVEAHGSMLSHEAIMLQLVVQLDILQPRRGLALERGQSVTNQRR